MLFVAGLFGVVTIGHLRFASAVFALLHRTAQLIGIAGRSFRIAVSVGGAISRLCRLTVPFLLIGRALLRLAVASLFGAVTVGLRFASAVFTLLHRAAQIIGVARRGRVVGRGAIFALLLRVGGRAAGWGIAVLALLRLTVLLLLGLTRAGLLNIALRLGFPLRRRALLLLRFAPRLGLFALLRLFALRLLLLCALTLLLSFGLRAALLPLGLRRALLALRLFGLLTTFRLFGLLLLARRFALLGPWLRLLLTLRLGLFFLALLLFLANDLALFLRHRNLRGDQRKARDQRSGGPENATHVGSFSDANKFIAFLTALNLGSSRTSA
ncbi:hypothetical protein [Paracoccus laeviglucosivorans]|uniref:hypothetical protein n=1 Tax=Paracoccus laeviglucosivorans TaxID=1197861 RepID=UPI001FEBB6F0|nr:hypothetical protein [Paracoccus laeviglucosivorans]